MGWARESGVERAPQGTKGRLEADEGSDEGADEHPLPQRGGQRGSQADVCEWMAPEAEEDAQE